MLFRKPKPVEKTAAELADDLLDERDALAQKAVEVTDALRTEIALDLQYVDQRRRAVEEEASRIEVENGRRKQKVDVLQSLVA